MAQHGNERGAAGCRQDPAFPSSLNPFQRLGSGGHIPAKPNLHHIRETGFFQSCADGSHIDLLAELAFRRRCAHRHDPFAGKNIPDYLHGIDLGTDRSERAAVDAVSAMDAFIFVDAADPGLVIKDGIHGTGLPARTFLVNDGAERTGLGAHAAAFAFRRIYLHFVVTRGNGAELAGIQACFSKAEPADIRYKIILDRAVVAGSGNHGDNV